MNKNKQIIVAGAIGDALGYKVEFDNLYTIECDYGHKGISIDNFLEANLQVSDDTQMTLFCLSAINKFLNNDMLDLNKINEEIFYSYLDWLDTQENKTIKTNNVIGDQKSLYVKRAPGITCLTALHSRKMGTINKKINNSKGCGGVMRTAPVAFLNLELKDIFKLGCMQAAITHGHPLGYLSSGFFAGLIYCLSKNILFSQAIDLNIKELKKYEGHKELTQYINNVMLEINKEELLEGEEMNNAIGLGWVAEELLGIALYAFMKGKSFSEVLDISINHSGDSDSTGSLAAQLYVAANELPLEYYSMENNLDVKNVIEVLMEDNKYRITKKI